MPQSYEEIRAEFKKLWNDSKFDIYESGSENGFVSVDKIADWWLSQRDADKGGESVNFMQMGDFHCLTCHNSFKAETPTCFHEKQNPKSCTKACGRWFSPKPQANVGEWEKEFDERMEDAQFGLSGKAIEDLKNFIREVISTTSAQKLESLEREVRELLIKDDAAGRVDGEYYIDTPEQKEAWNYTINQVLKIIK